MGVVDGGGDDAAVEDDYNLLFEFVAYGVLLNVIGVFGILGNVISMIILSRPQMKSSINYLLIGLARCDTVLIVTSIILFGLPVIYPTTNRLFVYYFKVYPLIAPVVYPIAMISQTVSVYLTLTVTLERFVAVCHPLRARSLCTYGRARAYVVAIIAFAVLYNITRFWEVRVQKCMHTGYQQYVYQVYPSELRNDKDYISVYIHWMYLVIMYFIPFGSLAVLNAAIYNQVSGFPTSSPSKTDPFSRPASRYPRDRSHANTVLNFADVPRQTVSPVVGFCPKSAYTIHLCVPDYIQVR